MIGEIEIERELKFEIYWVLECKGVFDLDFKYYKSDLRIFV